MTAPIPQHLDQWELAARWRLSARTLERWRTKGSGPGYLKLGQRVSYRLTDIEAFEAAQYRANSTGAARMQEVA